MSRLRVGVIGVGGMGTRHAHNLARLPAVEVTAVADPDVGRRTAVAAELSVPTTFDDPLDLIRHENVDAVVIASPDPTHAPLAMACLQVGKPTLVEKPLAVDPLDARELVEAEARNGCRLLQVGFMRAYDPAHVALQQVVADGEIGEPLLVLAFHDNPATDRPRPLREVLTQSAIHDFHTLRMLTGREPDEAFLRAIPSTQPGSARLVTANLRLGEGCLGQVVMNTESGYGYWVMVEVAGSRGVARLGASPGTEIRRDGWAGHRVAQDWLSRFALAYQLETEAWVEAARAGTATGPSAWDGYVATLIAEACLTSATIGKPITIDPGERPEIYRPVTAAPTSAAIPQETPGSSPAD